jgi:hypothetical protein
MWILKGWRPLCRVQGYVNMSTSLQSLYPRKKKMRAVVPRYFSVFPGKAPLLLDIPFGEEMDE